MFRLARFLPIALLTASLAGADVSHCACPLGPATWGLLRSFPEPRGSFTTLAFTPGGRHLAIGTSEGEIVFLSTGTWAETGRFKAGGGEVSAVAFCPDRSTLAAAEIGAGLRVLSPDGAEIKSFPHAMNSAAFSPDGARLAFPDNNGRVRIVDAGTFEEIAPLEGFVHVAGMLEFSGDGKYLALGHGLRHVLVYDTQSWSIHKEIPVPTGRLSAIALSGDRLLIADAGGGLASWRLEDGQKEKNLGSFGKIAFLAPTPDGRYVFAAEGNDLLLVDFRDGASTSLRHHTSNILAVAVSPNGRYAASIGLDRQLKIWGYRPGGMRGVPAPAYLGVMVLDTPAGPQIAQVLAGTAAAAADLRAGDVILRLEGAEMKTMAQVIATLGSRLEGDEVEMTVSRQGTELPQKIKLGKRPDAP